METLGLRNISLLLIPVSHLVSSSERSQELVALQAVSCIARIFLPVAWQWKQFSILLLEELPPATLPETFPSSEGRSHSEGRCIASPGPSGCSGGGCPCCLAARTLPSPTDPLLSALASGRDWATQHHTCTHSLWQKLCAIPFLLEVSIF